MAPSLLAKNGGVFRAAKRATYAWSGLVRAPYSGTGLSRHWTLALGWLTIGPGRQAEEPSCAAYFRVPGVARQD